MPDTPKTPMKLTANQQELLESMRTGTRVVYSRYMGRFNPSAYYFRCDNYRRCTAAARALLEKGLVQRWKENAIGDHELIVKPE